LEDYLGRDYERISALVHGVVLMDFEILQKEYSGKFVAILNDNKVVASGLTYNEVFIKVTDKKLVNQSELSIRFIRPTKGHLS
jgi:hypothetical protein